MSIDDTCNVFGDAVLPRTRETSDARKSTKSRGCWLDFPLLDRGSKEKKNKRGGG